MQTSRSFFRSRLFWAVFGLASAAATVASIVYFPQAMPLLDITITMNRQQALEQARSIANIYNLGPADAQQVAYFNNDEHIQNYIELHAGGNAAFQQLLKEGIYYPYKWQVRHFKEGVQNEATFMFSPTGQPYGFSEIIAESQPGEQLSPEQAQEKAAQFMRQWGIQLDLYKLIESSHENRTNGRRDYTLVYQRTDKQLKDAHFRITVSITGNKVTTLNHFIDIPEFFSRSYQEMRAANETIASFAQTALYVLYFFGGCFLGMLFLLRKRALWPKPALYMGIFIAVCQLLVALNQVSFLWFCYDTALSVKVFWLQYSMQLAAQFVLWILLYSTTFIVAEGLTRQAFGARIQLWRMWDKSIASSYTVLGKTLAGYLIIGFDLAFVVFFYSIGTKVCGWWSPASSLVDPNILSTYAPGLGVLARAVTAGFWEECLFRALPLALSALIGKKLGSRNLGIISGFLLQAVIFGAAHANYATQPAYVRVIELIIPSFVFGGLYLAFGLLPGIIAHTVYDALLFALPLFVSTAPGMLFQKMVVLIGITIPLLVVFFNRFRAKKWHEIEVDAYNSSWAVTTEQPLKSRPLEDTPPKFYLLNTGSYNTMAFLGMVSLACFTFIQFTYTPMPILTLSKQKATHTAQQALLEHTGTPSANWYITTTLSMPTLTAAERFIWSQNSALYYKLLGSYLPTPQWHVRFAHFAGDLTTRAEQFNIYVDSTGTITRLQHQLPETSPGKTLIEHEAREKALSFIGDTFKLNSTELEEISANATKQPERQDWSFTFAQKMPELTQGQARITVTLSGDKVTDSTRFIFIPEEWLRQQKKEEPVHSALSFIPLLCFFIVLALSGSLAVHMWQKGIFALRKTLVYSLIIGALSVGKAFSLLPEIRASLSTSQSISAQLSLYFTSYCVQLLMQIVFTYILSGVVFSYSFERFKASWLTRILLGVSIGCFMSLLAALFQKLFLTTHPLWPCFEGASSVYPWLTSTATFIFLYSNRIFALLSLSLYARITTHKSVCVLLWLLATGILMPSNTDISLASGIVCFILLALSVQLLYRNFIQYDPLLIPIATVTLMITNLVVQLYVQAYPGAFTSVSVTILALIFMTCFINYLLKRN
ncbi:CPBP family intramembrane metalloprotease [Candidatus Dependentiae bacterium]|nr:CPBP family intramembrane metalloprotease [Candidatus Dependentiae bacterium]